MCHVLKWFVGKPKLILLIDRYALQYAISSVLGAMGSIYELFDNDVPLILIAQAASIILDGTKFSFGFTISTSRFFVKWLLEIRKFSYRGIYEIVKWFLEIRKFSYRGIYEIVRVQVKNHQPLVVTKTALLANSMLEHIDGLVQDCSNSNGVTAVLH